MSESLPATVPRASPDLLREGFGGERWRRLALRGAGWGLAWGLALWSFAGVDPAPALRCLASAGPWLLLALVPHLLGLTLETWGWRSTLAAAGHPVGFRALWTIRIGTEALGQVMPGGPLVAESIKPHLLQRHCGLPLSVGVAATAHRKFVRLLAHGIYVLAGVALGASALAELSRSWLGGTTLGWMLAAVGCGLLASALVMGQTVGRGRLAERLWGMLLRLPSRRLRRAIREGAPAFLEADRQTAVLFALGPRVLAAPVLACVGSWCCEALETWLILELLGAALGLDVVLACELTISLARQILFVLPAGLGVQEAGYLGTLSTLAGSEVLSLGAAFVVVKRLKELCCGLLGVGLLGLLRECSKSGGRRAAIARWRLVDARDRGGEASFEVISGYRLAHVEGEAGALPGCELREQLSNFPGREP